MAFQEYPAIKGSSTVSERQGISAEQQVQVCSKVAIILCTYNGQQYLTDQLDSFAAQTHANWEVWASDDGSQDSTYAILETYKNKWEEGRLSVCSGPAKGHTTNFLSLIRKDEIQADYYAYSDQDDIWEADKLQRAINWLRTISEEVPALYCSRARLVDSKNQDIGLSPLFTKPPCFANALTQNVGSGNTMVFNNAARKLLCEAGENVNVITHDWWTYMVISGCGGKVFYDPYPSIRYRQHSGNLIGMDSSWTARLVRGRMLWDGQLIEWTGRHIQALQRLRFRLTPENLDILDRFCVARKSWLVPRLIGLMRSGIYRQTLLGNLGLVIAVIFKKI